MTVNLRRLTTVLIFLCVLLSSTTAFAHVVVEDAAKMFDKEDVAHIKAELKNKKYNYYIVTLKRLEGENIDSVGKRIASKKRLGKSDVLLTLVKEEREVNLNVPPALDIHPKSVLDEYFVPHAADGDFVAGVVDVAAYLHEPPGFWGGMLKWITEIVKENLFVVIALAFFALPVVFVVFSKFFKLIFSPVTGTIGLFKRHRLAQQKHAQLLAASREQLAKTGRASDKLAKRLIYSDGETKTKLTAIEQQLTQLLEKNVALTEAIAKLSIPWRKKNQTFDKLYKKYNEDLKKLRKSLKKQTSALQKIVAVDDAIRPAIDQSEQQLAQIKHRFHDLRANYLFSFDSLEQRIRAAQTLIAKADDLEEFDPLAAEKPLKEVASMLQEIEQSLSLVTAHETAYTALPQKVEQRRAQIRDIVQREQLKLVDIAPFANISRAEEQLQSLEHYIQIGDTKASTDTLEKIDSLLEDALAQVRDVIRTREANGAALHEIEQSLTMYSPAVDAAFAEEIRRVEDVFAEKHWRHIPEQYEQMKQKVEDVYAALPPAKTANDPEVQEYKQAKAQVTEMQTALKEAAELQDHCLSLYGMLMKRRDGLQIARENTLAKYRKAKKGLEINDISLTKKLKEMQTAVETSDEEAKSLLAAVPYDLDAPEEQLKRLEPHVATFAKEAKRLTEEKKKVEKQWREAQAKFANARTRYGKKIKLKTYTAKYNALDKEIAAFIKAVSFKKAADKVKEMKKLASEMKKAYNRVLEAERRAEERKRERYEYSSSSRSSGSSSWGGSSSSSSYDRNSGSSSW